MSKFRVSSFLLCILVIGFSFFLSSSVLAVKVLTYNICWECMSNSSTGSAAKLGKVCTWTKKDHLDVTKCAINIADQIDQTSAYYGGDDYDFVGLQESKNWKDLQKISASLKDLKAVQHKVVSFYNPKKYTLDQHINTQFEPGRPIQILIFKENIIFVNLHAPHASSYQKQSLREYAEDKLSAALKSNLIPKEIEALNKFRIIVVGDFNDHHSSLFNDNQKGRFFVPFRKANLLTPVFLGSDDKREMLSCCSNGTPYKKPPKLPSDYIFDSKPRNELGSVRLKVPTVYNYDVPSSDHLPVIYKTDR